MKEEQFDLKTFNQYLIELVDEMEKESKLDPDYEGELDNVIASIKRLIVEFRDKKYETILPDLFVVFDFLGMMKDAEDLAFEDDEDFDWSDLDDEESDEDSSY